LKFWTTIFKFGLHPSLCEKGVGIKKEFEQNIIIACHMRMHGRPY